MDKYERRRLRLIELRDSRCNGKAAELARAIGREPSYVSRMLYPEGKSGKKRIADDMMEIIEAAFRLPRGWLDHSELELNPTIETFLPKVAKAQNSTRYDVIEVPYYTLKISASTGEPTLEINTDGMSNYCCADWARHHSFKPENLFSIVVVSDSMEPTIPKGASLIVHKQTEIENGRVHVICHGNEFYVKRLYKQMDGSILIHSDNEKKYKEIMLNINDLTTLFVIGLVVAFSMSI